jgi:hypothetical protein
VVSFAPYVVRQHALTQLRPQRRTRRQRPVQQRPEPLVVPPLDEVGEFMHDDVLDANRACCRRIQPSRCTTARRTASSSAAIGAATRPRPPLMSRWWGGVGEEGDEDINTQAGVRLKTRSEGYRSRGGMDFRAPRTGLALCSRASVTNCSWFLEIFTIILYETMTIRIWRMVCS